MSIRLAKSYLHLKDFEAAQSALKELGDHPDETRLLTAYDFGISAASIKEQAVLSQLLRLPRYLPTLQDYSEYYVVGHDNACAQVNEAMMQKALKKPLAFFFGGVGDARNLYATMIEIVRLGGLDSRPPKRKYHATINDIKPSALARDIVLFYLRDDLSQSQSTGGEDQIEQLTVIFYLFVGAVVPQWVSSKIQKAIQRAESALRGGTDTLPWIHVRPSDTKSLVRSFQSWQIKKCSACSVSEPISNMTSYVKNEREKEIRKFGEPHRREGCEIETRHFTQTGAHWPPVSMARRHEPLIEIDRKSTSGLKKYKEHVCRNWRVNVTMLDEAWTKSEASSELKGVLTFNPFDMMSQLYKRSGVPLPKDTSSLFEFVAPFFELVAYSLQHLRNRFTVEIAIGEVSSVLDMIRYELLDRPKSFPHSYDKIQLSNIP